MWSRRSSQEPLPFDSKELNTKIEEFRNLPNSALILYIEGYKNTHNGYYIDRSIPNPATSDLIIAKKSTTENPFNESEQNQTLLHELSHSYDIHINSDLSLHLTNEQLAELHSLRSEAVATMEDFFVTPKEIKSIDTLFLEENVQIEYDDVSRILFYPANGARERIKKVLHQENSAIYGQLNLAAENKHLEHWAHNHMLMILVEQSGM